MPTPLVPATLDFSADGTPYSTAFDDVYHSSAGGPAQARHVFLGGNGLPARWRGRERFTILETGFGLGLNFLTTRTAWQEDPERATKLHFVSIEKHPFTALDLVRLHAPHVAFAAQSAELRAAWPMLVPGMHRLEFDAGRVVLTLYFGDVAVAVRDLRLAADAFFLDGFAPSRNPGMWAAPVLKSLAKLAAAGATLATYTAASPVRDALALAGFGMEKRPGFGKKRDMLCARYVGWGPAGRAATGSGSMASVPAADRRALVIGAGLAGSAVCERLAARGWQVALIERHAAPAQEASGNHAGVFHPLVTRDDSFMARLSRASFLHALRHWRTLERVSWARCGVLQMARDDAEEAAQRAAMAVLAYPANYAVHLGRAEAARVAGAEIAAGGLWFAQGGWIQPVSLAGALLAKAKVSMHFGVEVARLERNAQGWSALAGDGQTIATAPIVVLANARDAVRLAPLEHLALRSVRGQISHLPADRFPQIRAVLLRSGFVLPPVDGIAVTGATYDLGEEDPEPRADSHAGNLERLARVLPGAESGFDPAALRGRVAFRAVTPDRLPVLGPMPDGEGLYAAFAYASRGILWCSLMAELLASRIEGEPWPVEARLADAVAPARFGPRGRGRG